MRCHDATAEGFVTTDYAKTVFLGAALYKGWDKAEALAVWRKAGQDSDDGAEARELIADATNGEIEIFCDAE